MKTRVRPDDASMLQLNDWLAALREDGRAEPPGYVGTEPPGGSTEPPADRVRPAASAAGTWTEALSRGCGPAARSGVSRPVAPAGAASLAEAAVRTVIGDQLRMPIMWCEMGSCISWHADPASLGEGDARARAIGTGWRIDAFGRLACPRCQQTDPDFRATRPVVLWDRHTAIVRAARIAVARGDQDQAASLMPARWPAR